MFPPPGFTSTVVTTPAGHVAALTSTIPSLATGTATTTSALMAVGEMSSHPLSTTWVAATATVMSSIAASATTVASSEGAHAGESQGECKLLGPFALFVQGGLGLLAMLSLVWKRHRERPRRPLKVWAFDVSKQVVGSLLVHVANLLMSMLSAGQFSVHPKVAAATGRSDDSTHHVYQPNPCSFYLLNLAIDTTLGIPVLIFLLRITTKLCLLTPFGQPAESIQSGNYGRPPKTWWWFKQSIIYFLGLLGMKICVYFIFALLPWISRIGDWALRWTEGNEMIQVFFVMLLFPVIMNALQYYIIDSFIKDQTPSDHEPIPSVDENASDDDGEHHAPETDVDPTMPSTTARDAATKEGSTTIAAGTRDDYDPDADAEDSPTVYGSGSRDEQGPLLSSEATTVTQKNISSSSSRESSIKDGRR
ncbi:MAG: hypothetical protein M1838_002061 [Thelocarpon superellum]|nr:MAG: hypothetical protein M1838_002061 [Thelocarpon superellum]